MATLTIQAGRVKYAACPPKDYGNGPRVNVVVILADGQETKLWGDPDSAIAQLKKGENISVAWNGKSYLLADHSSEPTAPPQTAQPPQDFATALGTAVHQYELAWGAATALLKRQGIPSTDPALIQRIASDLFSRK